MPASSRGVPRRRARGGAVILVICLAATTCLVSLGGSLFLGWPSSSSETEALAQRAIRLDEPMDNFAETMMRNEEGSDASLVRAALSVQLRALRRQAWRIIVSSGCDEDTWTKLQEWFEKRCRLLTVDERVTRKQLKELRGDWQRYLSLCSRSSEQEVELEKIRLGSALVAEEAQRTAKDLDAKDILLEQQNSIPPREVGFGFKVPYLPIEVGGVVGMGGPGGLRGNVKIGLFPDYQFRQKLQDTFQV
ncbi:hypothetical protein FOL47_005920 [Perkinsus chesapeaki]|uniref:Uncharacterized protein n=1 Tax=Perkinsus chesapeaki TaxID=330153 RepID=A0A7J6LV32_PERCH|nr:hypothetical protein FOL47_005920 [Perkinsus chesapeaki]